MTFPANDGEHRAVLALVDRALRALPAALPELAELIPRVRVQVDSRVGTAGIFSSGRLVVSPSWFGDLSVGDAMFVLAHELMHLLLRTHERSGHIDPRATNIAHDYIINDMLREILGREIPAAGLDLRDARNMSLEALAPIVAERMGPNISSFGGGGGGSAGIGALGAALGKAGLGRPVASPARGMDVLDEALERDWYPADLVSDIDLARAAVRTAALRAVALSELNRHLSKAFGPRGDTAGGVGALFEALHTAYAPPWHEALQTWMEAVAPGERTYSRPSRRGADRTDVVLPGRRRDGWTLHIVLDTSGSMTADIAYVLGTIASFCESARVAAVRILQCDTEVTKDELVPVEELWAFEIGGFGGSDMSPAMWRLAQDPEVEAAIVITDGYIAYPETRMPYEVLWAVTQPYFVPAYGRTVVMDAGR